MPANEASLEQAAWSFETDLLNILILSIRKTSTEWAERNYAWTETIAVKSIHTNVDSKIDSKYVDYKLDMAKRIMRRWMQVKSIEKGKNRAPKINFGKFLEGTKCQWPGDCLAQSPTAEEKKFVHEFYGIVILRDLFCIQADHLLANRWGGKEMIPLCGLHNRQKQDAMWPTILINHEVI